jgi:DNA repair exonuclease SbcCD ATPase subunit
MFIKSNGDVQEIFYFSPYKSDSLPLSMGSGSQKFVGSIAITDALHSVSCLMKPNLRIIDEGFGTLDEDKTADIGKVFSYLSNKYKNILIITHRTEIKDFVNNIIQVTKSTSGLLKEQIETNPEAGISQFSITY